MCVCVCVCRWVGGWVGSVVFSFCLVVVVPYEFTGPDMLDYRSFSPGLTVPEEPIR